MEIAKIFYINIASHRERRQLLEQRLERHFPGIPAERVDAVWAPTLDDHVEFFRDRLRPREQPVDGRYPYPGTIGCFLSHYRAVRQVLASWSGDQQAACLVLEDDCVFDGTILPLIRSRLTAAAVPQDWKVIKHSLGMRDKRDAVNRLLLDVTAARGRVWQYYHGTHFLIYRAAAGAGILRQMETEPITSFDKWVRDHIDGAYTFANPMNIKQSNLGGSHTNPDYAGAEHEDRSPSFRRQGLLARLAGMLASQS